MKTEARMILGLSLVMAAAVSGTGWKVVASYTAPAPNAVVRAAIPFPDTGRRRYRRH